MILRSHNHAFLRHITEHSALEIYRRRLLGIEATRKAVAVNVNVRASSVTHVRSVKPLQIRIGAAHAGQVSFSVKRRTSGPPLA